jgi:hypothetical protein
MKKERVFEKIKYHHDSKKYAQITREVAKGITEISNGYIIAYSPGFILLHEVFDFSVAGYNIIPIAQIAKVRFNRFDKYFDKILTHEKVITNIGIEYPIDLDSWRAIFQSLEKREANIIVECESPEIDTFTIGPIVKAGDKKLTIKHFNAEGYFDNKPTRIAYADITKIQFDNAYINTFSKYTRYKGE